MRIERSATVAAEPEQVVALLLDVDRWPDWLPTIDAVERAEPGPIRVGTQATVRQPKLPPATWTVTQVDPARGFTWESRAPGVTTVGSHEAVADGVGTLVRLTLTQSGPLAWLARLVYGRLSASYVEQEAAAVKATGER